MAKFWRQFFLAFCALLFCWQIAAIAQPQVEPLITPEVTEVETLQGAPVVLGDDELFRIKARIASFEPEFRAKVISERLLEFAKNEELDVDYLQVIDNEETQTSDVLVGTTLLATFADVDAVAEGEERYDLAKEYQNIIRDAVVGYRAAFSLRNILLGVAYTIISSIILLLSLFAINLSLPRVHRYLRTCQNTWIPAFKIFGVELLSSKRVVDLVLELVKILRLTTWLTLIYIYGNLVLSFFPWTQGFARRLFGYARSAVFTFFRAGINYLPNLFLSLSLFL